jgi:hypothetical protein
MADHEHDLAPAGPAQPGKITTDPLSPIRMQYGEWSPLPAPNIKDSRIISTRTERQWH